VSLIRREFIWNVQRVLLAALLIVGLAIVSLGVRLYVRVRQATNPPPAPPAFATAPTAAPAGAAVPAATRVPTPTYLPPPTEQPTPTPGPPVVGIVAGHWPDDVGAVCVDGLTEVEINHQVAERVVHALQQRGYEAEVLAEFSPKLNGYRAAALVSIHADACNVPEASGFKVARVSSSSVPALEDQLVACLSESYAQRTGLSFHRNSITFDMTEYHAFYEIEPQTPAAIIEVGFMAADRWLLTQRQDLVAQGIVDGLLCFLEP
jgi:N-acetylmuramoyl-L-alanine amidase